MKRFIKIKVAANIVFAIAIKLNVAIMINFKKI